MGEIDYKQKYQELRANFLAATNRAYQVGYEHGAADKGMQAMQEQQQMQMQQAQGMPMDGEAPSPDQMADQIDQADLQAQQGDLESALQELEQELMNKSQPNKDQLLNLTKSLSKSLKSMNDVRVRTLLRKSIGGSLTKSERLKDAQKSLITESKAVKSNLDHARGQALSMQQNLVDSVIEKMTSQSADLASEVLKTVKKEGHGE